MVITRAKNNVCFYDTNIDQRKPIEKLWAQKKVVTDKFEQSGTLLSHSTFNNFLRHNPLHHDQLLDLRFNLPPGEQPAWLVLCLIVFGFLLNPGSHIMLGLTKSKASTKKDWQETGIMFFKKKRYSQAALCFEKCGDCLSRDKALAFYHATRDSKSKQETVENFEKAYTYFDSLNKTPGLSTATQSELIYHAAHCAFMSGKYLPAANYFHRLMKEDIKYGFYTALSFEKAGHVEKAVTIYQQIGEFSRALDLLFNSKKVSTLIHLPTLVPLLLPSITSPFFQILVELFPRQGY